MKSTPAQRWCEAAVLAVIREKFAAPAYAVLDHVRSNTAYSSADRTIDAVVMGLWPSRGLELWGMEIKSERRDWIRELNNPEKAERLFRFFDRFFLVTGHLDVATNDEIPAPWGWMVVNAKGNLITKKPAPINDSVVPPSRDFLASLLRNVDVRIDDTQRKRAFEAGYAKGKANQPGQRNIADMEKGYADLAESVRAFEEASGVRIQFRHDVRDIGRAVRYVMHGTGMRNVRASVERAAVDAERIAEILRKTAADISRDDRPALPLFTIEHESPA